MAKLPTLIISEYAIITADTPDILMKKVTQALSEQWQPMGGVALSLSESDDFRYVIYAQAIIRLQLES